LGRVNREGFDGPLVAITGSSGKTSVKNLVASVLGERGATLATRGNYNNEIGVPLTLLRLSPEHEFAVVEMGAAGAGDIAYLCELARPSIALLLNAMPAHLEGFGSVEGVVQAKGEIFDRLGTQGTAVINADQPWAESWRERAGSARVLDFGMQQPAAVYASNVVLHGTSGSRFHLHTPLGGIDVTLNLPGRHSIANALAAAAAGVACGLDNAEICRGLQAVTPDSGRLVAQLGKHGATIIDDCYNANPGSVMAAVDLLAGCPGRRTLVLGAMLELGEDCARLHTQIGDYTRRAGIEQFWGVGAELQPAVAAFGSGGRHFADRDSLLAVIDDAFGDDDTVLVKGSRGAAMELVLGHLLGGTAGGEL
jgi:UDP-N-acetylmuramoyl-tripeptide--D-alanyl-D-alanine ligase